MTTLSIPRSTELADLDLDTRVWVTSYGLGTGARLVDVGRLGTVIKINRTRAVVRFDDVVDGTHEAAVGPGALTVIDTEGRRVDFVVEVEIPERPPTFAPS